MKKGMRQIDNVGYGYNSIEEAFADMNTICPWYIYIVMFLNDFAENITSPHWVRTTKQHLLVVLTFCFNYTIT